MKIGIYHPFTHFPDNYSLSHVAKEQMLMILEAGHECHFITSKGFPDYVPKGVTLHAVLPSRNGKKIEKSCREIIEELDVVLTHDVTYLNVYSDHLAIITKIAKANPKIRWLHWVHSAPNPNSKRAPVPNSIYVGMNRTDIPLLAEQFQVPEALCQVIYNSVTPDMLFEWHPLTCKIYWENDLFDCDVLVTYPLDTGRFESKGGYKVIQLIEAFRGEGRNAKVVFVNAAADTEKDGRRALPKKLVNEYTIFTSLIDPPTYETVTPHRVVSELMRISNLFPLLSMSEGCSLTMIEAGVCGNLVVLNEDFPPLREFGEIDLVHYMKTSSTRGTTNYNAPPEVMKETGKTAEELYYRDHARIIWDLLQTRANRFNRKMLKRFNRKFIWQNQLEPLLEIRQ